MGKINKMLYMLDLLNTGNKYTVKELANKLEVTERMIRYYKNEFEKSGIFIDSFKGPNGGYFLIQNNSYYTYFNKYDIDLLNDVSNFLLDNDYKNYNKYCSLIEKCKNLKDIEEEKRRYILNVEDSDSNSLIGVIKKSIENKDNIQIAYKEISGEYISRIIHPIYMFKYNSNTYVTAFCELRFDIRHFDIDRIKILKATKKD